MANIFSLVSKKNEAIQAIQKYEDDEQRAKKVIADLKQLYPQEYKSKQEELENEIKEIQEELACRASLALTYIENLKESIDGTFLDELADALVESSRLIFGSHLLLDRKSRPVSRYWEDERWWNDDIPNRYIPRTGGLAPMLLRSGTIREIRSSHSNFYLPLGTLVKKEFVQELLVKNNINVNSDLAPFLKVLSGNGF
jgi:hypothetical protein